VKERSGRKGGKGRGREGKRVRREGTGGEGIGEGNVKVGHQAKILATALHPRDENWTTTRLTV